PLRLIRYSDLLTPCRGGPAATRRATTPRARRSLLLLGPLFRRFPLRAGLDHRERDAPTIVIDRQHPYSHHIADRNHLVRILDIPVSQLADVHEATVFEADIDERAEIDHVQDRSL